MPTGTTTFRWKLAPGSPQWAAAVATESTKKLKYLKVASRPRFPTRLASKSSFRRREEWLR
jgi:hypothetical protein